MHASQLTLDNSQQARRLREELPGSWYNYEPSEITLVTQQSDHWLGRLKEAISQPAAQSQA